MLAAAYVAARLTFTVAGLFSHSEPLFVRPQDCGKAALGYIQRDGANRPASARIECERR